MTLEEAFITHLEYWFRHRHHEFVYINVLPHDEDWEELQKVFVSDSFLRKYNVMWDGKIYPRRLMLGFGRPRTYAWCLQEDRAACGTSAVSALGQGFFRMRTGDDWNSDVLMVDLAAYVTC